MKSLKLFLFVILFSSAFLSFAQEEDQKIKSTITQVTVFLNGAQLVREAKVQMEAGLTRLTFDNLSQNMDPNSVQVSADNAMLMSVQFKVNYLRNQEKSPHIQMLQDSLEQVNYMLDELKGKKFVLDEEKSLLLTNKSIGGQNNGVQIAELEDAADFFRRRLTNISEESLKLRVQETKLRLLADKLNSELAEFNQRKNAPSNEVNVVLKTERPAAVNITLSYYVYNANWQPFYDIRVKDTQSPVQLFYKARITQTTGESWDNVKLRLSTGNPSQSGQRPTLNPAFLQFIDPSVQFGTYGISGRADALKEVQVKSENKVDFKAQADEAVTMTQTPINIVFDIAAKYSIPADGNPQTVDIRAMDLKARYSYICIPKLDKEAFLLAHVYGNNEIYQLNGMANVYFEGTYVGQSRISATTDDTLEISLGRDKRIIVERTKVKEFCVRNKIGGNIKESVVYEISIRNTRNQPIDILIEDQIPVSQNKDIEVSLKEQGGASYDAEKGKLSWNLRIAETQTQKLRFGFELKFPKDKQLSAY